LPEVIGDAGVLVPPTDKERIEAALLEVVTRPDLRQDLIARGHRQAARFNWSETARQTLKVFADARGAR
jgi:glycosyltransferase involved in cell wall biosynthesis